MVTHVRRLPRLTAFGSPFGLPLAGFAAVSEGAAAGVPVGVAVTVGTATTSGGGAWLSGGTVLPSGEGAGAAIRR